MEGPGWGALGPRERVTLSGRIFMGGNKALNRVVYMVQEEKMTNLELEGCVWMYALPAEPEPAGLEPLPARLAPRWIQTPLPEVFFQIFKILGLTFAGTALPEADLLKKNGVRALVPKAEDAVLAEDKIVRIKSVWWMNQGLRSALWEVNVRQFGPFEVY
jgi:tartrate dehydratase beta subunit/fumarate hydratase class I family protein